MFNINFNVRYKYGFRVTWLETIKELHNACLRMYNLKIFSKDLKEFRLMAVTIYVTTAAEGKSNLG